MPTTNPRLSITLTPAAAAVLDELAHLAGNSKSAIVGELLESSLPIFERVVHALRSASTIQEAAKGDIVAGLERAQAKLEDQLQLAMGTMDDGYRPLLEHAEKVSRRAGRPGSDARSAPATAARPKGSTPVAVTRGSGHPAKQPKGSGKGSKARGGRGGV